jgi:SAM-dependent methyltransferase
LWYSRRYGLPILLNIGAGPGGRIPGWLSLDYSGTGWCAISGRDMDIDSDVASSGIPLGDSTVDAIYCSHFLEHLNWFEGEVFLSECRRVLKPGAGIRLAVPDADYFIKRFMARDEAFFGDINRCYNHWLGNITDTFLWNFLGAFSSHKRNYACHAMFYNFENLSFRLNNAGFAGITRKQFGETGFAAYADELKFFPGRELPRNFEATLIVEASRI